MPVVVPVKFPFAARELWFDPQDLDIVEGDYAVCSTERGTELSRPTRTSTVPTSSPTAVTPP